MNRLLIRLVTLLLFPGLILDPAWAAPMSTNHNLLTSPIFQQEAFVQRAVPYLHSIAWKQKIHFDQWFAHALAPGVGEMPRSVLFNFLSRRHRQKDGTLHLAHVAAWSVMWAAMAASAISVFHGIPGWAPSSHGLPDILRELLGRASLSNMTVHTIYNSIAPHFGWPLLMIEESLPPNDMWSARTGKGFGKMTERGLTPAESDLQFNLALALHANHNMDATHADQLAHTLLMLRGDELKMLFRYEVLNEDEALLLQELKDGALPEAKNTQLIESLSPKLAKLYKSYEGQLKPVTDDERRRGIERDSSHGFDEEMLAKMLSSHLLPWPEIRRLQRTYHLGRDLAMVTEALSYADVEKHILDRKTVEEEPGGRADPIFYRDSKPVTIMERKQRALRLQKQFEDRLEVFDFLKSLKGTKLSYTSYQRVHDQACILTIGGTDPIPLTRGQTIRFSDRYDLEFIVSGVDRENRLVSLIANSGEPDPVSRLAAFGEILLGDDRSMEEREEPFLKELLRNLKAYMANMPNISENYNSLLGLTSLIPRHVPEERSASQPVKPLKYLDDRMASNLSQTTAVHMSFDPPRLLSIQGPAATTKTSVGTEIANQWIRRGKRVLYLSQMHSAVDEAGSRMKDLPIIRVGNNPQNFDPRPDKNLVEFWPGTAEKPDEAVIEKLQRKRKVLAEAEGIEEAGYVVFATNAGIVKDSFSNAVRHKQFPQYDLDFNDFDIIIMDEASRESLQGALLPLQYLKENGKLVLLGDTRQIGAYGLGALRKAFVKAYRQMKAFFDPSEADRIADVFNENFQSWVENKENMDVPRITLTTNFRQHPLNARLTSEVSYNNEVHVRGFEDFNENTFRMMDLAELGEVDGKSRYFEKEEETEDGISFYNETSLKWGIKLVQEYRKRFGPDFPLNQITIETPYIPQVLRYEEALQKAFPNEPHLPIVTTISSYQGGQNKYLIVDPVRSNQKCDIGLMRDPGFVTVSISRDQIEKTIICDTRMFWTRGALSIRDQAATSRAMLAKVAAFYRREVMPFFSRKKLTMKDIEPSNGTSDKKAVPPTQLLEAIRDRREELLSQWDTHLMPVLTHVANVRHAHEAFEQSMTLKTEEGWSLGAWWWEMLDRWEAAGWDQTKFEDTLIADLGGRRQLNDEQREAIRIWAKEARRRRDAVYESLVSVLQAWAATVPLDETRDLDSLSWLYQNIPCSPLRRDIRNQFSEHVKVSLDHWRNRITDLVAYEKKLAGSIELMNALSAGMTEKGLELVIRAEERRQYEEWMRERYSAYIREQLNAAEGPRWRAVARDAMEDSKFLRKAVGQEYLAWGKNQLTHANGDIAKIRQVRVRAEQGAAIIWTAGSLDQMRGLNEVLNREYDSAFMRVVDSQLNAFSTPDWTQMRDLYENESMEVRRKIEQQFDFWGRAVIDRAGESVESVNRARATIEESVRSMNPEAATIHFEGSFLQPLRDYGAQHLIDIEEAYQRIKPVKRWERDAVEIALYSEGFGDETVNPILVDDTIMRKILKIDSQPSASIESRIAALRDIPLLAGLDGSRAGGLLKAFKETLRPSLAEDLKTAVLVFDVLGRKRGRPQGSEAGEVYREQREEVRKSLRERVEKAPDGSPAIIFAPTVMDVAILPDSLFSSKHPSVDLVTLNKKKTREALEFRIKRIEEQIPAAPDKKRPYLRGLVRGLKTINVIEAGFDMMLSQSQIEVINDIIQTSSTLAEAETRLRQMFREFSESDMPEPPAVSQKLQNNAGIILSSGLLPDMLIFYQIAIERQLLRKFIERGELSPDSELPNTFNSLQRAKFLAPEEIIARQHPSGSFVPNDYLRDMELFENDRYLAHYYLLEKHLGIGGVLLLSSTQGRVKWANGHFPEDDAPEDEMKNYELDASEVLTYWAKPYQKIHEAAASGPLTGGGDYTFTLYTNGVTDYTERLDLVNPGVWTKSASPRGKRLARAKRENFLPVVENLVIADSEVGAHVREAFLKDLRQTMAAHYSSKPWEHMNMVNTLVAHIVQDAMPHSRRDMPNVLVLLNPADLAGIPVDFFVESHESVIITIDGDSVARMFDQWLYNMKSVSTEQGDSRTLEKISIVKDKIDHQQIRIAEADLLGFSPEFLMQFEVITEQASSYDELKDRMLALFTDHVEQKVDTYREVAPRVVKPKSAGLVLSLNVIPSLQAFAALTLERRAAVKWGKNAPKNLDQTVWFHYIPGDEPGSVMDSPLFLSYLPIANELSLRHLSGYLQHFAADDGRIFFVSVGENYIFEQPIRREVELVKDLKYKLDSTDALTLWARALPLMKSLIGHDLIPEDGVSNPSSVVHTRDKKQARGINFLLMKVLRVPPATIVSSVFAIMGAGIAIWLMIHSNRQEFLKWTYIPLMISPKILEIAARKFFTKRPEANATLCRAA